MSRVVVVTGGTKGIGKAVAERFAAAGDRVEAVGRDALDVTDEASVQSYFERLGRVDVLVNNAGIASGAPLARTTLDDWRAHLDVNATGAFLCTRAVLGGMIERGDGRIVTVASVAGLYGRPLHRCVRGVEARRDRAHARDRGRGRGNRRHRERRLPGVRGHGHDPADGRERSSRRRAASAEEAQSELETMTPLGRLLEPDEVAAAVVFLASPEAAAINGQTLVLDGGGLQT